MFQNNAMRLRLCAANVLNDTIIRMANFSALKKATLSPLLQQNFRQFLVSFCLFTGAAESISRRKVGQEIRLPF